MDKIEYTYLENIGFEKFEDFIKSLDSEKESWSLDMNVVNPESGCAVKDIKEWYDVKKDSVSSVAISKDKIVGLISTVVGRPKDMFPIFAENLHIEKGSFLSVLSFVVKKEYQGKGIGTRLVSGVEKVLKKLKFTEVVGENGKLLGLTELLEIGKHVSFLCATYYNTNIASYKAFKKNGFLAYGRYGDLRDQIFVGKKIGKRKEEEREIREPSVINGKVVWDL
jgi:GNAT superfamily N-acetyltransferase